MWLLICHCDKISAHLEAIRHRETYSWAQRLQTERALFFSFIAISLFSFDDACNENEVLSNKKYFQAENFQTFRGSWFFAFGRFWVCSSITIKSEWWTKNYIFSVQIKLHLHWLISTMFFPSVILTYILTFVTLTNLCCCFAQHMHKYINVRWNIHVDVVLTFDQMLPTVARQLTKGAILILTLVYVLHRANLHHRMAEHSEISLWTVSFRNFDTRRE